ncbi:MAG: nucleotidyltransferase domain-containing protein [Clostridium sp.]
MGRAIIDYQKAFLEITEGLKKNSDILAIFVFGSMVTGDLWEESDIDLFVICNDEFHKVRDVYTEVLTVPVHSKFISKRSFIESYEGEGIKGTIKNTLLSSKLIFSKDDDISNIYSDIRYSINLDRKRWNLVYLGAVLKDIGVCKKYLHNGGLYTSYEILIRVLDNFSNLYLNMKGYVVSKDSLKMACNLSDSFDNLIEELFSNKVNKQLIEKTLGFIENHLNYTIKDTVEPLLEFLESRDEYLSSYEIERDEFFSSFKIKIEYILKYLYKKDLVNREFRDFKDPVGNKLTEESVYAYKSI